MASCFVKVRAHTESHPVYTRANQILAALPQVLTSQSSVSYYAALLSLIQGEVDLEPGVLLFALSLQSVPLGVLQSEASSIHTSVSRLVKRCTADQPYLAKYSVKVMERLLQVQTKDQWQVFEGTCVAVFGELLALMADKRAPLHKQASSSLLTLLRKGISSFPKALSSLQSFVLSVLQNPDVYRKRFDSTANVLRFLAAALQIVPVEIALEIVPVVAEVATNESNAELATQAYLALEATVAGAKLPSTCVKELLLRILRSSPMSGGSESLQQAYIQCLTQLLRGLNQLDADECYQLLSPGISSLTEYLVSNQPAVQQVAATAITSVVLTCVSAKQAAQLPKDDDLSLNFDALSIGSHPLPIQKVAATVVYLLNERFQDIIDLIFPIITAFLRRISSENESLTARILLELEKYAGTHCQRAGFKRAVAAGLNSLGATSFFRILPMQLCSELTNPEYMTISRSWVLPIAAEYMEVGDFAFFLRELFPAYLDLDQKREAAEKESIAFLASRLQVLEMQVWLAFPRFCARGNSADSGEAVAAFRQMIPRLAKFFSSSVDVRSQICRGLVHIAESASAFSLELRSAEDKFLPLLFNTLLEKGSDKDLLSLIRAYPLSTDFRSKMLKKSIEKAVKPAEEPSKVATLIDIVAALSAKMESFTVPQGKFLQMFITNFVKHAEGLVQKKAYKLANSLHPRLDVCQTLVTMAEIQNCAECARTERLRSVQKYLLRCDIPQLQSSLVTSMPEILQSIPDQSTKTRKTALDLGVAIGTKLRPAGQLFNYFNLVLVGLGSEIGSTKAAAITLMGKLVTEVLLPSSDGEGQPQAEDRGNSANYVVQLLRTVILTLKDAHREVVRATVGFLKSATTALDKEVVASLAGDMVKAVLEWPSEDVKEAIKVKVRFFLMKLIKKLGMEAVTPLFPESHSRLLHYLHKSLKRKTKKRTKNEHSESESEAEDMEEPMQTDHQNAPQEEGKLPSEHHFVNPLDLPAQSKRKKHSREEVASDPDIEYIDGKMHVNEDVTDSEVDSDESEGEGGSGKKTAKKKKGSEGVAITVSGEEYKSARATGDMRKPGKQQPFAYIEFNPKMLNKRKRVKASNAIEGIVKTAKQGVFKGLKARKRDK